MTWRVGIPRRRNGCLYAIRYPDGRYSDVAYASPLRAAYDALEAVGSKWWPDLAEQGYRIEEVEPD